MRALADMGRTVMSADDRAETIDELIDAYRERERLIENHQLAPGRGIDTHRYPGLLGRHNREIARLEEMLR